FDANALFSKKSSTKKMNGASELFRMGSNMSPNCEKLPDPKITRGTMGKFLYVVLLIEVVLGIFELLFYLHQLSKYFKMSRRLFNFQCPFTCSSGTISCTHVVWNGTCTALAPMFRIGNISDFKELPTIKNSLTSISRCSNKLL